MKRVVVIATLLVFVCPAIAQGMIVVNRSMYGLNLGSTMNAARHRFGRPPVVRRGATRTVWSYPTRRIVLQFHDNRLITLATTGSGQRTSRGVGVGSKQQDVIATVPHVSCVKDGSGAFCRVSARRQGRTYFTAFDIAANGLVDSVAVGVLP
jgi:hypothetical protein